MHHLQGRLLTILHTWLCGREVGDCIFTLVLHGSLQQYRQLLMGRYSSQTHSVCAAELDCSVDTIPGHTPEQPLLPMQTVPDIWPARRGQMQHCHDMFMRASMQLVV